MITATEVDRSMICDIVQRTTSDVFATMMGVAVESKEPTVQSSTSSGFEGVICFVGMAGQWIGTGSVHCGPKTACELASKFLMAEYDAVTDDVLDAIGELGNMIIGNFKNEIEQLTGPMGLSVPTVIHGRNFSARTHGNEQWIVIPFGSEHGPFEVRVFMRPNDPGSASSGSDRHSFILRH